MFFLNILVNQIQYEGMIEFSKNLKYISNLTELYIFSIIIRFR